MQVTGAGTADRCVRRNRARASLSATTSALRERCFGALEGLPLSTLDARALGHIDERVVDATARPEGGESLDDLYHRAGSFVEWLSGNSTPVMWSSSRTAGPSAPCGRTAQGEPMLGLAWDVVPNGSVWKVRKAANVQATKC